jgi:putative aldouronate transport system permease protein
MDWIMIKSPTIVRPVPKPYRLFSKIRRLIKRNSGLTLLALPGILLLFVFHYVPLYGMLLPFKRYSYNLGIWNSPWSGLENFQFLFTGGLLKTIIRNTLGYNAVFICLGTVVAVTFALLLFEVGKRFVKGYQTILFIPYFISWVVAGFAFRALLDMDYGIFNKLMDNLGVEPILWYNEPKYWPFILVAAEIWKGIGYGSVIYYAALMGIDSEYYEAAKIDGAGKLRMAVSISLPMIRPIIIMMMILQVGKIFYSDFGLFYNVTLNSSLLYSTTDVIDTYVYRSLIELGDIGMSSAAGFLQSIIGFALVLTTNGIVRRFSRENSLF